MRYAFVSDIHANLQAWQAVSADIDSQRVDEVICLGDVVGYGPKPSETLREIHAKTRTFIMGNHDAVVADILDSNLFNDEAQRMIEWTKKQLSPKARNFFAKMSYTVDIDCGGFTAICVHGAMHPPESFYYIYTESDARMTWDACEAPLVFVGHTHEPRADLLQSDGSYFCAAPQDFTFDPSMRAIINVGSVGLPRSQDPRACYAIFDTETYMISWHRVEYSIEALTQDIHATFGKDASRALSIFEHAAEVSQDEEFKPKLITSTQSIKMARKRVEERQKVPEHQSKVWLVASLILLLFILGLSLSFILWYNAKNRNLNEDGAGSVSEPYIAEVERSEEEARRLRSESDRPPKTTDPEKEIPRPAKENSDSGRRRANELNEADYEKMRELFKMNPPNGGTEEKKKPDDGADPAKTPAENNDPPDKPPQSEKEIKGIDLSEEIPESRDYQLLYELDLTKLKSDIIYDVDRSDAVKDYPVRVAYCLELKKAGGQLEYVYVSMNTFTMDLKKMGIPTTESGAVFQRKVKNLTIVSNVKDLATGSGIAGNMEFWPHRYNQKNTNKVEGASDKVFDFGDGRIGGGNYGSMQIHNTKAKQTVFAINCWAKNNPEMGIGNNPDGNPDWTFTKNASTYTYKRLRVLVKTAKEPPKDPLETDDEGPSKDPSSPTKKEVASETMASIKVGKIAHYFKSEDRVRSTRIADFTVEEGEGSKLVLVISWEGDKGVQAKWKGKDFQSAVQAKGGRNAVVMYLDNPEPGAGNIMVRFDAPTKALIGAVNLSGTAPGVKFKKHSSTSSFDYTTDVPRSVLVGVCTVNKDVGMITSPFNEQRSIYNGNSGSSFGDAGVKFILKEGKQSHSWNELKGKAGCSFAMAVFDPMEK